MAREKDFYRDNLELLNARYPDHDMLSFDEVKTVMGVDGHPHDQEVFRKIHHLRKNQ